MMGFEVDISRLFRLGDEMKGFFKPPRSGEGRLRRQPHHSLTRLSVLREMYMPTIWMICIRMMSRMTVTKSTSV